MILRNVIGFWICVTTIAAVTSCAWMPWTPRIDTIGDIEREYMDFRDLMITNRDQISDELWAVLVDYDKEIQQRWRQYKRNEAIALIKEILPMILDLYQDLGESLKAQRLVTSIERNERNAGSKGVK